jgi:hypothetical protein
VSGELAFADVELPFMQQSDQADCVVRDGALTCARSIGDPARQTPMILITSSDRVWGGAPKR